MLVDTLTRSETVCALFAHDDIHNHEDTPGIDPSMHEIPTYLTDDWWEEVEGEELI